MSPAALRRPIVCLVTDRQRLAGASVPDSDACDRLIDLVRKAAAAGVTLVQIREPDLVTSSLVDLVSRCLDAVRGTSCRLVVNDRLDVALACGAGGVHLRADSCSVARARDLLGPDALIGRSVHSSAEAAAASQQGAADYLVFGTVWSTASKPADTWTAGPAGLQTAVRAAAPVPVLAIGGVSLDRVDDVAATGAAGIAAIGLFLPAERTLTLEETVQRVQKAFDSPAVMP